MTITTYADIVPNDKHISFVSDSNIIIQPHKRDGLCFLAQAVNLFLKMKIHFPHI